MIDPRAPRHILWIVGAICLAIYLLLAPSCVQW